MGMGPVHVSCMHIIGEVGAATWEISTGSVGSIEAGDNRVP